MSISRFRPAGMDRTFWPAVTALFLSFLLFEFTPVDLWVQDRLFDFDTQAWLIDAKAPLPRLLAYTGPKFLIIGLAVVLLVFACGPDRWLRSCLPWTGGRRALWVVVGTLAVGPSLISLSKATTNVFCPSQVRRYGGDVPYVRVLESYPENDRPTRRGRCFPAGHASGGFALMSLAGLATGRRGRLIGLGVGLSVGAWMGGYQMLKGAHYLSHTVITALFVWIVFLLWRRVLGERTRSGLAANE